MILTRSARLSQPQGPVEISPDFGGAGVVYLPNVRSGITRVAGAVGRVPTPQGVSASYSAGTETKIERLTRSAPNGVTEFTQLIYLTPITGGQVQDRGVFGNWNTTGATAFVQFTHRARDSTSNGRHCYVFSYDPTSGATGVGVRTSDYSAVDNTPALLIATVKNNRLSLYLNGVLHGSPAVAAVEMSGQAELQIGNYYDNNVSRRLSATVHMAAFLPRGLGDSEVAALSRNPWQLFKPVPRRIYFDMVAGGWELPTHNLAGAGSEQQGTGDAGAVSQLHQLSGAATAQPVNAGASAVSQVHALSGSAGYQAASAGAGATTLALQLAGDAAYQLSMSVAGAVTQAHALAVAGSDQTASAGAGVTAQTHSMTGAPSAQGAIGGAGTVAQGGELAGAASAQPVTAGSAGVTQTHALLGSSSAQLVSSAAGAASQVHALVGSSSYQSSEAGAVSLAPAGVNVGASPSGQDALADAGAVSQAHALSTLASVQSPAGGGGTATQVHALAGASASQVATAQSAALGQIQIDLVASSASQAADAESAAIGQTHSLGWAVSMQSGEAWAAAAVQTHLLIASASSQAALAGSGSTAAFTYSTAPSSRFATVQAQLYTVEVMARDYAAAVPALDYTATTGGI